MISEVFSQVFDEEQVFRDVAYEWEEELAKYFDVPVRKVIAGNSGTQAQSQSISAKIKPFIKKIPGVRKIERCLVPPLHQNITAPLSVGFIMNTAAVEFMRGTNCIPIFLDVWSIIDIISILRLTKGFKLFYVTARDALDRIKAKSPSSNVRYMPQSVSDKYHSENFAAYRNKYIDVFMPGRGNPVLHEYMLRYAAEHPNIKYVYRRENFECISTDGSISLRAGNREEYIHLLSSSKVSLVGCSGIDNARKGTHGICFATPRFYESAILGCALLGRYPDNQEFTELNMRKYCPNITSYEQFCDELERALAQTPEELYAQNRDFILNSLTSKRAEQIQRDLESLS